jgi:hypothetical protein
MSSECKLFDDVSQRNHPRCHGIRVDNWKRNARHLVFKCGDKGCSMMTRYQYRDIYLKTPGSPEFNLSAFRQPALTLQDVVAVKDKKAEQTDQGCRRSISAQ